MNAVIIKASVSPKGEELIRKLHNMPVELAEAIKKGMNSAGETSLTEIRGSRFTGKGPFPPSQHKLSQITGNLYSSLRWKPANAVTELPLITVTGAMTSPLVYFRVHELGYEGSQSIGAFSRRPSGKGNKPRAKRSVSVSGHNRLMRIPARAPMQTGVREHLDEFTKDIGIQLRALWETKI
jgi:hypothetical protein